MGGVQKRLTLLLVTLLCLAFAAPAAGEVRSGAATDPQDQPPDLNNAWKPDIEQVRLTYDLAGSLTTTMRFYAPIPAAGTIYDASWRLASCGTGAAADSAHVFASIDNDTYAPVSVDGYTGNAPGTSSISGDRRELTVTVSHAALAGRDYRCAEASTSFTYNPCSPYESCGNTYFEDDLARFYFDGFPPLPPAPTPAQPTPTSPSPGVQLEPPTPSAAQCDDGIDNDGDGQTDVDEDWGCDDRDDNDERLKALPRFSRPGAVGDFKAGLAKRFGNSYSHGNFKHVTCTGRTPRFVCKAAWSIGDISFSGSGTVRYSRVGEIVRQRIGGRVRRTNEYCRVTGGRRCSRLVGL